MQKSKWALAADGDVDSIAELVEQYYRVALGIAHKWIRGGAVEYDEAISAVLFALMKCIRGGTFDPTKGKFTTYVTQAANNEIRMFLRKQNNSSQDFSLDESMDNGVDLSVLFYTLHPEEVCDSLDILEQTEMYKTVKNVFIKVLPELSERERQCFLLWVLHGCSHVDIAKRLGISQSYTSRLIKAAKEKLKEECRRLGILNAE